MKVDKSTTVALIFLKDKVLSGWSVLKDNRGADVEMNQINVAFSR